MENVHIGFEKYNCDECAKISYKILDWRNIFNSCSWRKRFNCDQCCQNFARGCYLKVYIKLFMKKTLNSIVITVAIISPKLSWIRQNTGLKLQITAVHENEKIKFWSMWQKFC